MLEIKVAIDNDDMAESQRLWKDLMKWDNIHMKMEEGKRNGLSPIGIFGLLDQYCEGIVEKNDLRHHHKHLYEYENDVKDAFENAKDKSEAVKIAFGAFHKENLRHLELEEKIMMPSLAKLKDMGMPVKQFMVKEILPLVPEKDLEFFIKFANEILQKHQGGMPLVRVFDHALWAIATPDQWLQWDKWIREVLSDENYDKLHAVISAWKDHQQNEQKNQGDEKASPAKEQVADVEAKEQAVEPVPPAARGCCILM